MNKKRIIKWGSIVVAIIVLAITWSKMKPLSVISVTIERGTNVPLVFQTKGIIRPGREVFPAVNKGGRLDRILVKQGDIVKKDQLLAVVEESTRTSAARSALMEYQVAARELGRARTLVRQGVAAQSELDEASRKYEASRASLETARNNLKDSVIRAPESARVAIIAFQPGDIIPDGSRLFVLEDLSWKSIHVKFPKSWKGKIPAKTNLTLQDVAGLKITTEAELQPAAGAGEFNSLGLEYQVVLKSPIQEDLIGKTIDLSMEMAIVPEVAYLPDTAVVSRLGQAGVLVGDDKNHLGWTPINTIENATNNGKVWVQDLPQNVQVVSPLKDIPQPKLFEFVAKGKKIKVVKGK